MFTDFLSADNSLNFWNNFPEFTVSFWADEFWSSCGHELRINGLWCLPLFLLILHIPKISLLLTKGRLLHWAYGDQLTLWPRLTLGNLNDFFLSVLHPTDKNKPLKYTSRQNSPLDRDFRLIKPWHRPTGGKICPSFYIIQYFESTKSASASSHLHFL